MGCCAALGRVVIILFNIVFIIVGLVFLAGGLFLKFGSDLYKDQLKQVEEAIEKASKDSGAGEIDISLDLGSIVEPVAYTLIGIGVLVLATCFFGCCGACYKIKCLLVIYVVIVFVMMAGEIILIVLLMSYPSVLKTPLASSLKSGIQSEYEDITGKNLNSIAWNVVMQQFKCCGVENYQDFTGASKWDYNYTSVCGATCILQTPITCCKTLPSGSTAFDYTCATNPTSDNNYMNTGCLDTVWNPYLGNTFYILLGLGLPLLLQLIFVILSIVILCDGRSKSSKADKSDKKQNAEKNTESGDSNNNDPGNSSNKDANNMVESGDREISGEIAIVGAAGMTKAAEPSKMKHNSMKDIAKNQATTEPRPSYLDKYFRYSPLSRFRSNRNKIYPTP